MKYVREQIPATNNFSAGQTVNLKIGSLSYWLLGLELDIEIAKTDGTTPTTTQDFLMRCISSIALTGGGNPYVAVNAPDLRPLYWAMRHRLGGRNRTPDMQAGAITFRYTLPIIFGVNPIQFNDQEFLRDVSAGIKPNEDLTLSIGWAAAGSTTGTGGPLGTNRQIGTSSLIRVNTVGMVAETKAEEPTWMPRWVSSTWSPSQSYSGESGEVKLDGGFYYRRSTVLVRNGASPADVRVNGLNSNAISEIAVITADGRKAINKKLYDFSQRSQGQFTVADDNQGGAEAGALGLTAAFGAAVTSIPYNPGVGMVDWAELADTTDPKAASPLYGINMIGKEAGTVRFGFTVDANTNTNVDFLHERYMPYPSTA